MSTQLAAKVTAARRRIYTALVAAPEQHWTVVSLAEALSSHATVTEGAVRDTVNLLLAHQLLELVPYQRALTVTLADHGKQALSAALRRAIQPSKNA